MKKIIMMFILTQAVILGQSTRELVNEGVEAYNNKNYTDAEVNFKKGIDTAPSNYTANYNLGAAYYKQERYDDAVQAYKNALTHTNENGEKAKIYHNIGNSFLRSQKIQESIEAYKKALKLNPNDSDTKYNLSYALSLLNNQNQNPNSQNNNNKKENQPDKDKNNQDQNKGNDGDNKDDKQNQDKGEGDKDKEQKENNESRNNERDQNKPEQNETAKQDNLKQKENQISKEEAERILQALKNNEKDLQKKLRKKTGVPVKTEKDW